VTDRRLTVFAVSAAVLVAAVAVAGCGDDEDTTGERAAKSSPPVKPSTRQVTARVAGRTLSGHCRGAQHDSPAIVLDSGMAAGQHQLRSIEEQFVQRTVVCAYDRAGVGGSDPPAKTPRPVTDLVADLDAFAAAASVRAPYLLVGQSAGANIVFMYAQTHPDKVAGLVSMNPVPPAETFIKAVRKVETKSEFEEELAFNRGENDEGISFNEPTLSDPLPSSMPYAVMFDEDCDGDAEFCRRILPPLTQTTKSLAIVGERGRFVRARDAGHNIFETNPELVQGTINDVLSAVNSEPTG
jgi:pimeloyl-ACP methyl ester carboxylesterase